MLPVTVPQPKDVTVEFFNEMGRLPLSRQDRIAQIAFQLRGMRAKAPSDLELKEAYLYAVLMRGDREGGIALVNDLWPARMALTARARFSFAIILDRIGLSELALSLGREMTET